MPWFVTASLARLRLLLVRQLRHFGFSESSFLLLLAVLIGVVTAAAAVGFHELIHTVRNGLYMSIGDRLYGTLLPLLIVLPAAGGLVVGLVSRYVFRQREGHGMIDVMESIIRSRGVVKPVSALEKILTSAVTIGSGGSAGAEGPIVQIGSAIASGIGQIFRVARQHMPTLLGCGAAAGISAIFNAPIGGVFFTLEVLLQDFSIRTFTPVVLASVISNVATKALLNYITAGHERWEAIFAMPAYALTGATELHWRQLGNFVLLGLICGAWAVALIRLTYWTETWFASRRAPRWLKPAIGGAMLGVLGILYVMIFGRWMLGKAKPFEFAHYPLPAFFSDGYGVIKQLISSGYGPEGGFYIQQTPTKLLLLLGFLCVLKVIGTCLTLSSGGSGGIIAPSLFLGACAGAFLGLLLRTMGADVQPNFYALVGMGAVLAAVVHAPLAAILILLELTQDYRVVVPVMLSAIIATSAARILFRDSIYTLSLRLRGVQVGSLADLTLLRRLNVEQVTLEPAHIVNCTDPLQKLLDLCSACGAAVFVVVNDKGRYEGMVTPDDIRTALLEREAIPLLLAQDVTRYDIPVIQCADDLASVMDAFSRYEISHLPVSIDRDRAKIIGLITRAALMRRYQQAMTA